MLDISSLIKQLQELQARVPELEAQLSEAAVRQAIDGGAAVRVVPEWFPRPARAPKGQPGNVDPWFGLSKSGWLKEQAAGFQGWIASEDGGRRQVHIHFASAAEWMRRKLEVQKAQREGAA
jgi:hypothetical protein